MMDIRLRDATSADSAFVFNVTREAIGPYVEIAWGWDEARELERHADRWSRQRFRVIVGGGRVAGYVSTAVYDHPTGAHPPCLYLHQLMILPAYQSRGIGSTCLGRIQAEARALGLPLRFRVLRVNPRALAFYLAAGCRVVDGIGLTSLLAVVTDCAKHASHLRDHSPDLFRLSAASVQGAGDWRTLAANRFSDCFPPGFGTPTPSSLP